MNFFSHQRDKIGIVLLVLLVLASVSYLLLNNGSEKNNSPMPQDTAEDPNKEKVGAPDITVPEGWRIYTGTDVAWRRGNLRIEVAYPPTWSLKEEHVDEKLGALVIEGSGHTIRIDQAGRGAERPYDYIRSIGGYDVRTWQEEIDQNQQFTFGILDAGFIIHATTPKETKEILESILSTVTFYE